MSVSVTEMAGQDRAQTSTSSKKRKHTDEERAERKKHKKQKRLEVEDSTEVLARPVVTETTKRKRRRRETPDEDVRGPIAVQQEAQPDIELPDVEEGAEAPATEEAPAVPRKRNKRTAIAEAEHDTTEQEDIELPDADDKTLTSPPSFTNSTTSTTQPTPPSDSTENSPFHTARTSLYIPCPAISLSTALPSLVSTHLTPLLLTYYTPLNGIILSITDASISSAASTSPGKPLLLPPSTTPPSYPQLALCADEAGVSFTWLTFTATTFNPTPTSTLSGYINVASEGFIGLILYNYFQVGIAKTRIPCGWKWTAPGGFRTSKKQPKKGRIRDAESEESSQKSGSTAAIPDSQTSATQDTDAGRDADAAMLQNTGYWTKTDGSILHDTSPLSFRVVDCEIVPSSARNSDKLALQIEGTLLDEEEEAGLLAEERAKFERAQNKAHGRANSPDARAQANMMSGGIGVLSREGSVAAAVLRHRVKY